MRRFSKKCFLLMMCFLVVTVTLIFVTFKDYKQAVIIKYNFNPEYAYYLKDATIITMESAEDVYVGSLLIEKGIITKIGDIRKKDLPQKYNYINCKGKYVLPGLSDMHVHLYDVKSYGNFLAYGVTSVRSMNGSSTHLHRKNDVSSGELLGPEVFVGSPIIEGPMPIWEDTISIKRVDEIEPLVKKLVNEGYDFVKIYETLTEEQFNKIMTISKQEGIAVAGHIPTQVGWRKASQAGLLSSEHLFGLDINTIAEDKMDEFTNELIESGLWLSPTPLIYSDGNLSNTKYHIEPEKLKDFFISYKKNGGKLIAGTDESSDVILAGITLHDTISYFVDIGFTNFEALQTATVFPAEMLGVKERIGTLGLNKDADLLVLDANPLDDIDNLTLIDCMFSKGQYLGKEWITQNRHIIK